MTSTNEQELFADTLLKLQIHSALAKEQVHHNKSPIPLLAQSCSLLDNLPSFTSSSTSSWTPTQRSLIDSLKIDAWTALADGCIQANDLIQAEASLQRLSTLQDAAAGPFSWRAQQKPNKFRRNNNVSSSQPTGTGTIVTDPTKEHRQAAAGLIQTWIKLRQVYTDMGKQDMANNYAKRMQKMTELFQNTISTTTTTSTPPTE
ncbi:hypothetical protein BGX29_005435 [Mortierella sp. GBA35]|nr:hypothetical protein BGX29_005435 [Mortierella sp. GBA35]